MITYLLISEKSLKTQEGKGVIISYMPSKVQGYNRELFTNSWFKMWKKGYQILSTENLNLYLKQVG